MAFRKLLTSSASLSSAMKRVSKPTSFMHYAATRSFATSGGDMGFRVLGIQQIAVGGLNKKALSDLWINLFGLKKKGTFRSESENVDEDILVAGRGPFAVEVDIMQPVDPNKSPKVHSPPLNHIGLWIDDLPKAVKIMEKKGVRFTPGGIRRGASGFDVIFIHPKGNEKAPICGEGVLIELVQAPKSVISAFDALAN